MYAAIPAVVAVMPATMGGRIASLTCCARFEESACSGVRLRASSAAAEGLPRFQAQRPLRTAIPNRVLLILPLFAKT